MFERLEVSADKYIVLDVETNGLSSLKHDLLSLSLYKPDDGTTYDRLFPLEMDTAVYTTDINGIRKKDLKGKMPLSQDEVDELFIRFELATRTILHYGSIDERFVKAYFKRHGLAGYESMHFFNMKKLICSSPFSNGNLSKDNLCLMFGIEGVQDVHSSLNDCILEWKLFEKIGGRYLLATNTTIIKTDFFVLSPDYIVPVSYLRYPNLARIVGHPSVDYRLEEVFRLCVSGKEVRRFTTNFSGMTIEHLINSMLSVERLDPYLFLLNNKKKLEYIGSIGTSLNAVPMTFNPDGTVSAIRSEDKKLENELNTTTLFFKKQIEPLIHFVRNSIFRGNSIKSQDISIDKEHNVLAVCDLSNEYAVLEIKTGEINMEAYKDQLYYEAAGRECYIMGMEWHAKESVDFTIKKVSFSAYSGNRSHKAEARKQAKKEKWTAFLAPLKIEVTQYVDCKTPIELKCQACGYEWSADLKMIQSKDFCCPTCHAMRKTIAQISEQQYETPHKSTDSINRGMQSMAIRYALKIVEQSTGKVTVDSSSYTGSKNKVKAHCNVCGYEWETRADHLVTRCWCPLCRKNNK